MTSQDLCAIAVPKSWARASSMLAARSFALAEEKKEGQVEKAAAKEEYGDLRDRGFE